MRESVIDKRRNEGWLITFWCTPRSVICQITTPGEFQDSPVVDVACLDFQEAVSFARAVCRRPPRAINSAADQVSNWANTTPEIFLALLAK
jgi:hypothetical protein